MQNDLREYYYMGIRELTSEEDIRNNLPSPDFPNYMNLMEFIYNKLNSYLKEQLVEMEESLGTEMHELYQEEVNLVKKKILIIEQLVKENKKQDSANYGNHLIFATRTYGGTYFENDLKDIPEEKYGPLLELIIKAREGFSKDDSRKAKPLTGPLAGLNELKDNSAEIRVFYRELGNGALFVTLAKTKKSQNDKSDQEMPLVRRNVTEQEYQKYKQALSDPKKRQEIFKIADETTENIIAILNSKKRGSK